MAKGFLPYSIDQRLLLPPDMREWLPEAHLALFISDVVDTLDVSPILRAVDTGDDRGRAGYHPVMMLKVLVYAYCVGKPSSRKIERATYEDVAFRVLSGDQHPDHDCIADFRKRHLGALAGLFAQVLALCQKAGLVKLGHIAIDGSKFQANASKHKAMSYGRMGEAEKKLTEEVERLLQEAERVDAEEDAQHGKGKRGDELPKELARRETRLKKIREAKAALEAEAKERALAEAAEVAARLEERARQEAETGKKISGRKPEAPDPDQAKPDDKAQRNFTDPESRIMPDGAHKGAFVQAYNAQIAVDAAVGRLADTTSADAGYFSEEALLDPALAGTELLVPPSRDKHGARPTGPLTPPAPDASVKERMQHKLSTEAGRALYRMRKAIVEPVFGQLKEARGFRRLQLRGLSSARAEFAFIALTHNLLKLFRSGKALAIA
jgi:transposase